MNKKYIYWEKQGNDRLCGLHCLNSILQGPHYSIDVLATIGKEIDEQEKAFLKSSPSGEIKRAYSANVLDDGFINISVLVECLKRKDIILKSVSESDLIKIISNDNHQDIGYICNLQQHWFGIRKIYNNWYLLDSLKPHPLYIKDMHLKFYFNDIIKKYHIFSVQNKNPYISLPKPDINVLTKNPNQFYLPINTILEMPYLPTNCLFNNEADMSDSDESVMFSLLNQRKNENFKWPESGGKKLNNETKTNMYNDAQDEDTKAALKLSMEEYVKNLSPPPEENCDEECISIMVKMPNKKIHKKFSITRTLSDVFYWIEYESAQNKDISSALFFRNSYFLFQIYPRRKFCKNQNGSIELHSGNTTKIVNNELLKNMNFEKEETFMVS